ncbi:MAG: GIY-YIG nuclease family protein [Alphaproteobacteria bacterium]
MGNYYVYMMANKSNRVLYIGVTNDLKRRVYVHKHKIIAGFTQKYNLTKLVYFEHGTDIKGAIEREKHLKGWLRKRKNMLIETVNPEWRDLSEDF